MSRKVAPYAGAWIESEYGAITEYLVSVAPYAGAWIERINSCINHYPVNVAPYAGAWIERSQPQTKPAQRL